MELVAADIGGTHARFAIAAVAEGRVVRLGEPVTLDTADCDGLAGAWHLLEERLGRSLPRAAALAAASPDGAAGGRLTQDIWTMAPAEIDRLLGTDAHLILNDFGAVAHAVANARSRHFRHLCGPRTALPQFGSITICGPGTGIGCAQLLRDASGYRVIETEGGHIGFAPTDAFEDALLAKLRDRYGRVSAERVCAGPGLIHFYALASANAGWNVWEASERAIWSNALDGSDEHAVAALDRFCGALGGLAGDLALAQGASAVVIAGGLGLRLRNHLIGSRFAERFVAKGRFRAAMQRLPVKLITHPQPGLVGAAAAFAAKFG